MQIDRRTLTPHPRVAGRPRNVRSRRSWNPSGSSRARSWSSWPGPTASPSSTGTSPATTTGSGPRRSSPCSPPSRWTSARPTRSGTPSTTGATRPGVGCCRRSSSRAPGRTTSAGCTCPNGDPVSMWVDREEGGEAWFLDQVDRWVEPRHVDGVLVGEATFRLPWDLPLGWHTMWARSEGADGVVREASCQLIVTPARLDPPRAGRGPPVGLHDAGLRDAFRGIVGDRRPRSTWLTSPPGAGTPRARTSSWSTRCTPPPRRRRWSPPRTFP